MARINLLPWREELREQRKQQFLVILGGVLVASAALVFLGDQYFTAAIENQNARNDFLRKEIVVLDARIKEISELKSRRQQLLERMKIIQDLQGNRPIIGRVFDQLVRTLPDGVYFTDLKMTGKNIAIAGAAESNNRVSNLMRNMDASEWLTAPTLNEVKAVTQGAVDQANVFQLTVQQTQPGEEDAKAKQGLRKEPRNESGQFPGKSAQDRYQRSRPEQHRFLAGGGQGHRLRAADRGGPGAGLQLPSE